MRTGWTWAATLLLASGCATVLRGDHSAVDVTSQPDCAAVYVNGVPSGYTPTTLQLKSKSNYTVEVRAPGHRSAAAATTSSLGGGWLVLDIVTGILPAIVDAATGAWYHQDPGRLHLVLKEGPSPPDDLPAQATLREDCLESQAPRPAGIEAQREAVARCVEAADAEHAPQLAAWARADCMAPRPPQPSNVLSTKKRGEKCTWSAECALGLACPWGRCIPWEVKQATR
jgi:hypothetical protein